MLNVATTVTLNLTLTVGAVSQEVVVTSEAPIIDKADASTGTVLDNQEVGELPINGRDYARFSLLTPGAIFRSNFIADLTFDGLHSVHNQFSIDGIDASRVDRAVHGERLRARRAIAYRQLGYYRAIQRADQRLQRGIRTRGRVLHQYRYQIWNQRFPRHGVRLLP